jgi:thioredoxin reductase (NADPH)
MSDYLTREIKATANIAVRLHTEVTEGYGSGPPRGTHPDDKLADGAEQVPAAALFVLIGGEPRTHGCPKPSSAGTATS